MALQDRLQDGDWHYVANRTGGFLGFYYHWTRTNEIKEIYIQIENAFKHGIKLVIKIGGWKPSTGTLYRVLNELKPYAKRNGLVISKPDKYKAGVTSTLAIVQNAFTVDKDGNLELEKFISTLQSLEQALDEYSKDKEIQQVASVAQ